MMNTQQAYNLWSSQYDTNKNKTRDLEAAALRQTLKDMQFRNCLEVGCGTGKNTVWLAEKAERVTAVDFSEKMLQKAAEKVPPGATVLFKQADITRPWDFAGGNYDLVSFSLVLEHISDLGHVFNQAASVLEGGGCIYVGELHPFKQYEGTKARFDLEGERHIVECFDHHVSDFVHAAQKSGLNLQRLDEHFDNGERRGVPRILTLLFQKPMP